MVETNTADAFGRSVAHFTAPARAMVAARLAALSSNLDLNEIKCIRAAAEHALHTSARLKLSRVLLLELHAAQRAGELTAEDDAARFSQFIDRTLQPEFAVHLDHRYPKLRKRLQRALDQQREAIETLVLRFIGDSTVLAHLLGRPAGRIIGLALGQGDLHSGGQTVARLSLEGGEVMYKPRSLRIDVALETFLGNVFGTVSNRIRVPTAIDCEDYGWAEFVAHRYCAGEEELRTFYRGLGHWLAVFRLLGGTDIHLENLIAAGPVPVVIDVESLFVAVPESLPSGYGDAYDLAQTMIRSSVLRTGIVPFRASTLGFDGVDLSAAGALPGQQPQVHVPVIVNGGTTSARLDVISVDMAISQNHPSPAPDVSMYWDRISEGFLVASRQLQQLDATGRLASSLAVFQGCQVRTIRRPTQVYLEIGRMLWHPASLHEETKAIQRAQDLLTRNAIVVPVAPSDPAEIMSEINDMRYGDIPIFNAPVSRLRIDALLADWRGMRIELEELTIRSALITTELNQRFDEPKKHDDRCYVIRNPNAENLDVRRRKIAADAVRHLLRFVVLGNDGSATWITPQISSRGWLVQPLQADVYFGLAGVAIALAGYQCEVGNGRADAVPGVQQVLDGALQILHKFKAVEKSTTIGALSGYGGQIWAWLTLHDLLQNPELLTRAIAWAEALEREGFDDDHRFDIVDGTGGAIVPLLELSKATGDRRWQALAIRAAKHLEAAAIVDACGVCWPAPMSEENIGGFAHGATGIGWALARLVLAGAGSEGDRARWSTLAEGAFAYQDSRYDEKIGNWLYSHQPGHADSFHTWCHGSVGIGLAAGDLYDRTGNPRYLRTLRRAVHTSKGKWGASHTLCHGDLSLWELFARAAVLDTEGCAMDPAEPVAQIISAIEQHGLVGGMTGETFTPGLMTGLAGAIHSLNRMHASCTLASPLLLERQRQAT